MDKTIKCLLVNYDNVLISEINEVDAEIGEPNCRLTNPYLFVSLDNMKPWIEASNQVDYMIRSDDILTMADPAPEVIEKYLELTNE